MSYILVIWIVVAGAHPSAFTHDWHTIGEFHSYEACYKAAAELNKTPNEFRCLQK